MAEFTSDNICLILERIKDYCADDPVNRVDRDGLAFVALYPAAVGAAHLGRMYWPTIARYGKQAWNSFGTTAGRYANEIAGAIDFVDGYEGEGPPPNSRAGYAGATMGKVWKDVTDGTLEEAWKDGKEKVGKVMDNNSQKVKKFWDSSNILI